MNRPAAVTQAMLDAGGVVVHHCDHTGVSSMTPVFVRRSGDGGFEARVGISMMGQTNMSEAEFTVCGNNPFHLKFFDNYASGTGSTEAAAVAAMKADMKTLSDILWAI